MTSEEAREALDLLKAIYYRSREACFDPEWQAAHARLVELCAADTRRVEARA